jgi:hypothetical protein
LESSLLMTCNKVEIHDILQLWCQNRFSVLHYSDMVNSD